MKRLILCLIPILLILGCIFDEKEIDNFKFGIHYGNGTSTYTQINDSEKTLQDYNIEIINDQITKVGDKNATKNYMWALLIEEKYFPKIPNNLYEYDSIDIAYRARSTLILNYTNGTYQEFEIPSGMSILDATKSITQIEKKYYSSFNDYLLTSINRVKNNDDTNMYWQWYQGNETHKNLGLTGANHHIIDNFEIIEWKYEKLTY